ncbi:hypothetical protein NQ314_018760 [Rhamnusium bicolor]|uniref:Nuclear nucleic acid-binding protein C1D n=1 Tax=Rhamnusium bicolor TaxID=1586634 RepID=A0AAV8WQE4_9CUCU|nr:hypothetical protein NQ314_018760 [Rhamnusium bicolor]
MATSSGGGPPPPLPTTPPPTENSSKMTLIEGATKPMTTNDYLPSFNYKISTRCSERDLLEARDQNMSVQNDKAMYDSDCQTQNSGNMTVIGEPFQLNNKKRRISDDITPAFTHPSISKAATSKLQSNSNIIEGIVLTNKYRLIENASTSASKDMHVVPPPGGVTQEKKKEEKTIRPTPIIIHGKLDSLRKITAHLKSKLKVLKKIDHMLDIALNSDIYDKLSIKEKVDYDLFIAYTLNTLYWLYLRSRNEDPNKNDIKNQLNRIKDYMVKAKQAHERQMIRPKIDQQAASRFVKHGIQYKTDKADQPPPNKKIKL